MKLYINPINSLEVAPQFISNDTKVLYNRFIYICIYNRFISDIYIIIQEDEGKEAEGEWRQERCIIL
jgi:hypothetical protein